MKYEPWEDAQAMCEFCNENADDFDIFIADKGEDPRFVDKEKYELSYCEANSSEYAEWVLNYEEGYQAKVADRKNDLRGDK